VADFQIKAFEELSSWSTWFGKRRVKNLNILCPVKWKSKKQNYILEQFGNLFEKAATSGVTGEEILLQLL
jgi:hypothetical protein